MAWTDNYPPLPGPWPIDGPVTFTYRLGEHYLGAYSHDVALNVSIDNGPWTQIIKGFAGVVTGTWTSPSGRHLIDFQFADYPWNDPNGVPTLYGTNSALIWPGTSFVVNEIGPTFWDSNATSDGWALNCPLPNNFAEVWLSWTMQRDPNPTWPGIQLPNKPPQSGPWTIYQSLALSKHYPWEMRYSDFWGQSGGEHIWLYQRINGGPCLLIDYIEDPPYPYDVTGVWTPPETGDYDLINAACFDWGALTATGGLTYHRTETSAQTSWIQSPPNYILAWEDSYAPYAFVTFPVQRGWSLGKLRFGSGT